MKRTYSNDQNNMPAPYGRPAFPQAQASPAPLHRVSTPMPSSSGSYGPRPTPPFQPSRAPHVGTPMPGGGSYGPRPPPPFQQQRAPHVGTPMPAGGLYGPRPPQSSTPMPAGGSYGPRPPQSSTPMPAGGSYGPRPPQSSTPMPAGGSYGPRPPQSSTPMPAGGSYGPTRPPVSVDPRLVRCPDARPAPPRVVAAAPQQPQAKKARASVPTFDGSAGDGKVSLQFYMAEHEMLHKKRYDQPQSRELRAATKIVADYSQVRITAVTKKAGTGTLPPVCGTYSVKHAPGAILVDCPEGTWNVTRFDKDDGALVYIMHYGQFFDIHFSAQEAPLRFSLERDTDDSRRNFWSYHNLRAQAGKRLEQCNLDLTPGLASPVYIELGTVDRAVGELLVAPAREKRAFREGDLHKRSAVTRLSAQRTLMYLVWDAISKCIQEDTIENIFGNPESEREIVNKIFDAFNGDSVVYDFWQLYLSVKGNLKLFDEQLFPLMDRGEKRDSIVTVVHEEVTQFWDALPTPAIDSSLSPFHWNPPMGKYIVFEVAVERGLSRLGLSADDRYFAEMLNGAYAVKNLEDCGDRTAIVFGRIMPKPNPEPSMRLGTAVCTYMLDSIEFTVQGRSVEVRLPRDFHDMPPWRMFDLFELGPVTLQLPSGKVTLEVRMWFHEKSVRAKFLAPLSANNINHRHYALNFGCKCIGVKCKCGCTMTYKSHEMLKNFVWDAASDALDTWSSDDHVQNQTAIKRRLRKLLGESLEKSIPDKVLTSCMRKFCDAFNWNPRHVLGAPQGAGAAAARSLTPPP